jgi:peptidyl-tRNA hydrolase, PTH1 family
MKLIAGLGNPGAKYAQNRHNVGFLFCDFFARKFTLANEDNKNIEINFEQNKKFRAEIFEVNSPKEKIVIAKPQTYMNLSGESIKKVKDFYKIIPENIFVAHDDLDIPLGKFKIQHGNGPKIHNGINSTEQHVGENFWRIRIGVDNRGEFRVPGIEYVLQNFKQEELPEVEAMFERILAQMQERKLI